MAQLDENAFAELETAMGEEAVAAMWKNFDGCYDMHRTFTASLSHELSYWPETTAESEEEENFRHWTYYYFMPDKVAEARTITAEWRDLFKSKNMETGYNVYISGLGLEENVYVIVQKAKNAEAFYAQVAKNAKMLGSEGKALLDKTRAITLKHSEVSGWVRPDLSYSPKPPSGTE